MNLKIGNYILNNGLMLAPMAGVTDTTFRLLCRAQGAEYTVSEMVCAKALCYEQLSKKKVCTAEQSATAFLARVSKEETPMAVQIFGSEPIFMAQAAKMISESSYRGCLSDCAPAAIDINMGCPVRKITSNGEGSALMKDVRLAADIVRAVADAVDIPVTVKIRAGWDESNINAPEFSKALEAAGASLICIHARTKERMYLPGIDLSVIEKTKKAVSIPVIGNGDIYSADDALRMIELTGCDGVMVGRGAQGNPWIFAEITARMKGEEYVSPTLEERLKVAMRQLDSMIKHKGERVGVAEAKKHMAWYVCNVKDAAKARARIMTATDKQGIEDVFYSLLEENTEVNI